MNKLFQIYWRLFGYPDLPPKFLLKEPKPRISKLTGKPLKLRAYEMAWRWWIGNDVEIIAEKFNVTRTRVVNCIWKVYYEQKLSE